MGKHELPGIELVQASLNEIPGGSILNALIDEFPPVQMHKAARVFQLILDILGDSESELLARVRSDPRIARLMWDTAHAAARAEMDAKFQALARVASPGVQDTARVDEARYLVGVVAQLEPIHVRVLHAMEAADLPRDKGLNIAQELKISNGLAEAICGDLLRLALIETTGMSFRSLHNSGRLADLGRDILRVLRNPDGP